MYSVRFKAKRQNEQDKLVVYSIQCSIQLPFNVGITCPKADAAGTPWLIEIYDALAMSVMGCIS